MVATEKSTSIQTQVQHKGTVPVQTNSFIILANSLASIRTSTSTDHSYAQQEICTAIPDELTEHNCVTVTQINQINLDMEYADDASEVSRNYSNIRKFKEEAPKVLLSIGQEYVIN